MKLWSYTYRELGRRRGRTALTLAGIVIGVAAMVAVTVVSTTTREAYRDMFAAVSGRAALEVVAPGQSGFDPVIAEQVEAVPGVDTVVPVVQAPAALLAGDARVVVMTLGVDPAVDEAARSYEFEPAGSPAGTAGGAAWSDALAGSGSTSILLQGPFARSQGLDVGSQAKLVTPSGLTNVSVAGLLEPRGTAAFNGGALVILPLSQAQDLFQLPGQVNGLQLVLQEGADEQQVEEAVAAVLPAGLAVQVPGSRGQIAEDSMLATEQGLNVISALSLVAATFIVLNAFLMNVGERRRELAMLRAIGTTRRQLVRLILREALLLGAAGTVLGLGLGLVASVGLTALMERLLVIDLPGLTLSAQPFVLALVLGIGVTLLSAYVPARLASRTPPLEGLTGESADPAGRKGRGWPALLGIVLSMAGLALAVGIIAGGLAIELASPALVLVLVGFVLVIPLAIGPLARVTTAVLRPLLGTEGSLASRQLRRHPTRTSLTVGVLFVAVAVTITMGSGILNNVRDTGDWYERTIVGDYFLRGAMPDLGTSTTAALSEDLGDQVAALPAVDRVDPLRFVQATVQGERVIVLARPFAADRPLPLDLQEGDPSAVLAGLRRGEAVVGTMLAQRLAVAPGGEITLDGRDGPVRLRVAGTVTEYTGGGSALYLEWGEAKRVLDIKGADLFLIAAKPGQAAELGEQLAPLAEERGLLLQSFADLRAFIDNMINGVVGFLWLLMALVFLVASLGIVNTLTMNVLEQTRELGLLRAIAMTRGQVRKTILAQAMTVGVISLIPGALVGVLLAYLSNRATYASLGQRVEFRLDPFLVVGSFAVALLIAVLAAYLPARRAARLQLVEALQYE